MRGKDLIFIVSIKVLNIYYYFFYILCLYE